MRLWLLLDEMGDSCPVGEGRVKLLRLSVPAVSRVEMLSVQISPTSVWADTMKTAGSIKRMKNARQRFVAFAGKSSYNKMNVLAMRSEDEYEGAKRDEQAAADGLDAQRLAQDDEGEHHGDHHAQFVDGYDARSITQL